MSRTGLHAGKVLVLPLPALSHVPQLTMSQQSRNWCFTLNNYTPEEEENVKQWSCKYLVYGREVGESLTPHLQGTVCFDTNQRLSALKKLQHRCHWEPCKAVKQSIEYCKKDGNVFEKGDAPMTKSEAAIVGCEKRWALAKAGRFEELPPESVKVYTHIYLQCFKPSDIDELQNEWRWGESGVGKSSSVRRDYPGLYLKDASKWWDNYRHEEVVLIEDWDRKTSECLVRYLKVWADHYSFRAEYKGGYLLARPKRIIVTSNYPIGYCFDDGDCAAISRRFREIRM